jgi:hypothetical protein
MLLATLELADDGNDHDLCLYSDMQSSAEGTACMCCQGRGSRQVGCRAVTSSRVDVYMLTVLLLLFGCIHCYE